MSTTLVAVSKIDGTNFNTAWEKLRKRNYNNSLIENKARYMTFEVTYEARYMTYEVTYEVTRAFAQEQ